MSQPPSTPHPTARTQETVLAVSDATATLENDHASRSGGAATKAATQPENPRASTAQHDKKRWIAFTILCLGTLMVVLDTTVVNVASPSIQRDLGFSESNLAWVVNAYMLTFGGFLLLGGRMGDLYGPRRLFLAGLTVFTLASLACGLAHTQTTLIAARAIQGLGAAVVSAVSMALIFGLFPDGPERAKAMGFFGFVASGGGAVGAVVGGYITKNFDWHWNFLVNIPIGILVFAATMALIPRSKGIAVSRLDYEGAATITASLLLAVYGVVQATQDGWTSTVTLLRFAGAIGLMALFVVIERKAKHPLVQLKMLRDRNIIASNLAGILWAGSMFAWFFLSALYMQKVLGLEADVIGRAFLPANVIMAAFSIGLSAKLIARFGIRGPLAVGLGLAALGLLLFARAPVHGNVWIDVYPGMLILGVGAGMAFNPLLMAAMSSAKPEDAGLASGLVNTAFMMGGALGLAVLTSLSAGTYAAKLAAGAANSEALNAGYHVAFLVAAACAATAAIVGWTIRVKAPTGDAAPPMH